MKTPKSISFTDKLRSISIKSANIKAALFYQGTDRLAYKVWHKGKLLFCGNDFKPGMFTPIDSKEAIMGLLSFMSVKPGDTDDDYFKDYTQEQLAFTESADIEELSLVISDWEDNLSNK